MLLNTENIKIARKNAGYSTSEATRKVCGRIKSDKVSEWEAGKSHPTWTQLEKLADAYHINIFLLTQSEKIKPHRGVQDYRKKAPGERTSELNNKKFINFLLQRQKYLEYIMRDDDVERNELVGIGHNYRNPERLAQFITEKINYQYNYSDNHLKYLISLLEQQDIFVMKTLSYWGIAVSNMRGLYLKSEYAPIIALNRKDSKTAQLFTLAHEMAHLFTNSEGISNIDFRDTTSDRTESFCNEVAANFLLPANKIENKSHGLDDIEHIAETFQVSKLCVFYRLKNLHRLEERHISAMEKSIKKESEKHWHTKQQDTSGGGNAINNMKDTNGQLFNNYILSLYFEERINAAEATKMLKLPVDKV